MVDAQLQSAAILNELSSGRRSGETRRTLIANGAICSEAQFVCF